ncbi:MAG: Hsp20/alpha crystallin family protein [Candidatus Scatosoma sp.]
MKNYLQKNTTQHVSLFDALDDFFRPVFADEGNYLKSNISETENDYRLDVAVPGFSKDQIKLSLEDGYLNVVCNKQNKEEKNEGDKKGGTVYRRKEIAEYSSRSFYVGDDLSQEDIKAKYENGILSLIIPKVTKKVPDRSYIAIE